jgi:hypothetical protein
MVAVFVMTALGARAGAITDNTTCGQWASANVNRQNAYARLYVREHRPLSAKWGPVPIGVINAINAGCYQAWGEGVEDSTTVVRAISRQF